MHLCMYMICIYTCHNYQIYGPSPRFLGVAMFGTVHDTYMSVSIIPRICW